MDQVPSEDSQCNNSLTSYQKNIILIVYAGSSVVSFLVSLTAVLLVLCLRLYPLFVYRLALYQELSSIFISLTQCFGLLQLNLVDVLYDQDATCTANAFLLQTALWVKLMFTLWLVFHLFCLAVFLKNWQQLEPLYIASSILFPFILAFIPLFTNTYGVEGARCWIRDRDSNCSKFAEGIAERYGLWLGPAFISLLLANFAIVVMLLIMRRRAYKEVDPELTPLVRKNKQALRQMLPLVFYPLIFVILMLLPSITRVISDSYSNEKSGFELNLLHGIAYPPGGFFSGLAVIIHICVMRSQRKRKKKKTQEPVKPPKSQMMYDKCMPSHELTSFTLLIEECNK